MKYNEMHLNEGPYTLIEKGIKNIEFRVNDEKRQKIKIGDTITFYKRPLEKDIIKVKVIDLKYYKNQLDMYTENFCKYLQELYKTPLDAANDSSYYTEEEVEKYGCVAIYFEKI